MIPDLNNISLYQLVGLTCIVTILDVVGAMLLAVIHRQFSIAYVAVWIETHTIKRVFPIFALAWLGSGVPQIDIPAIGPLFVLAVAGLATYLAETVKSIQDNFSASDVPPDTTAVPSPVVPKAS